MDRVLDGEGGEVVGAGRRAGGEGKGAVDDGEVVEGRAARHGEREAAEGGAGPEGRAGGRTCAHRVYLKIGGRF